jgi:hypothetical protein
VSVFLFGVAVGEMLSGNLDAASCFALAALIVDLVVWLKQVYSDL